MFLKQFFVDGLGCISYLIGCSQTGTAAVIDPQRDVREYLAEADRRGLQITHVFETHLHADHVSGCLELAERTGATIYLHERAQAQFPYHPVQDGDQFQIGKIRVQARHTPGHTLDSLLLLVSDLARSPEPWLALTGDLLFVGDVGRPDLAGASNAPGLAAQLYDSVTGCLLPLDDGVLVYPGHGAGSLCGRSLDSMRSTSLGYEKHTNPAFAFNERSQFIEYALRNLPVQPANHGQIKQKNRQGPALLGDARPAALTAQQAYDLWRDGGVCLDTRPKAQYVDTHIPGSVNLLANADLSNRVGYVIDPDRPVFLLLENEQSCEQVFWSLARVGLERIAGTLAGGVGAWQQAGLPVTAGDAREISTGELSLLLAAPQPPVVVDLRDAWELENGMIQGARSIPLDRLAERAGELDPAKPVVLVCSLNSRSQVGAAVLWKKGFPQVYNLVDGMLAWQAAELPVVMADFQEA